MTRHHLRTTVAALAITVGGGSMYGAALAQSGSTKPTPSKSAPAHAASSTSFVHEMAADGMAEVQLGQLASQHAANADVKAFGEMMVKDHTKANDELKPIAQKLNVTVPTDLDQKHKALYDRLSKLQGAAFDKEYINAMVQGHQEVLTKLRAKANTSAPRSTSNRTDTHPSPAAGGQAAGSSAQNSVPAGSASSSAMTDSSPEHELTMWASNVAPTVQQHLDRAKELQRQVAK